MNTNSNTYTVIYSIGLVVVVAAVLAFVAKFLQPMQDENVKKDTISQILKAADITVAEGDDVLKTYKENLDTVIVVKFDGSKWNEEDLIKDKALLSKDDCSVYDNSMLKKQMNAKNAEKKLPVYIFKNGVTVIPCYGAGLWGPIWGYIGLAEDLNTIKKACFGHKGETPGLGAKITDAPAEFADYFANKKIGLENPLFTVGKNVDLEDKPNIHAVNAISGATITSQAVGKALNEWFGYYKNYFAKMRPAVELEKPEEPTQPTEPAQGAEENAAAETGTEDTPVVTE